jgi:hypothetical protein
MTQIAIDHSGRIEPARSRHDDGYIYHVTGRTQAGDEVFSGVRKAVASCHRGWFLDARKFTVSKA